MKRKIAILLILICSLFSFAACSSDSLPRDPSSPPKYTLEEKPNVNQVKSGNWFSYSVDMKMEKKCRYRGTSSYAGLVHVSLYTEIDGVTYTLKAEPVPISADIGWVTLKQGQIIKVQRKFEAVVWDETAEEYVHAPEGPYHAKFSFFGVENTLSNVITIIEEVKTM